MCANQGVLAEGCILSPVPTGLSHYHAPLATPPWVEDSMKPECGKTDEFTRDEMPLAATATSHLSAPPGTVALGRELVQQIRGCVLEVVVLHASMDAMAGRSTFRRTPRAPLPPPPHSWREIKPGHVAADNARLRADLDAALLEVHALEKALKASRQALSSWVGILGSALSVSPPTTARLLYHVSALSGIDCAA